MYDDRLMNRRPWPWLRSRILGLLTDPDTRITRWAAARDQPAGP